MSSDVPHLFSGTIPRTSGSTLFPSTTLFRSGGTCPAPTAGQANWCPTTGNNLTGPVVAGGGWSATITNNNLRSEERRVGKEYSNGESEHAEIENTEDASDDKETETQTFTGGREDDPLR